MNGKLIAAGMTILAIFVMVLILSINVWKAFCRLAFPMWNDQSFLNRKGVPSIVGKIMIFVWPLMIVFIVSFIGRIIAEGS